MIEQNIAKMKEMRLLYEVGSIQYNLLTDLIKQFSTSTPFASLLHEIVTKVENYNLVCGSAEKKEIQKIRDELSALSVTLAVYHADYHEMSIGDTMRRKINEAKEVEKLLSSGEVKALGRAELKAKVNVEKYYEQEVSSEGLTVRSKFIREQVNQVLHSIASRIGTFENNQK